VLSYISKACPFMLDNKLLLTWTVRVTCWRKDRDTGAVVTGTSDFWRNGTGSLTVDTVYRMNRTIELLSNLRVYVRYL
jgi:hypothetical protein